jgi:hypothetical protein
MQRPNSTPVGQMLGNAQALLKTVFGLTEGAMPRTCAPRFLRYSRGPRGVLAQ